MSEQFDYKEFAESMAKQSEELVPKDLSEEAKKYLVETLKNYTLTSGEALVNDATLNFDADQIVLIVQVIAEWTFHKCVDLAHSEIPQGCWDGIMQKIAFTVFEIAKQGIKRGIDQGELLKAIEHHVSKVWNKEIEKLVSGGECSEEVGDKAKLLSNIDERAEKAKKQDDEVEIINDSGTRELNKPSNFIKTQLGAVGLGVCILALSFFLKLAMHLSYISVTFVGISLLVVISVITFIFIYENKKIRIKNNDTELHDEHKISDFLCIGIYFLSMGVITVGIPILGISLIYRLTKIIHFSLDNWFTQNSICLFIVILWAVISMGFFVLRYFDNKIQNKLKELERVRNEMQDLINPDKMYERLGVDVLSVQIGAGLLLICDPDQDGQFLAKLAALRQKITDEFGYIIPTVRTLDSRELEANEYKIFIRDNVVASGYVYPNMYMVIADQWDEYEKEFPEDAIVAVDPTFQTQAYWISDEDAKNANESITVTEATDVIITHLKEVVIKHVDEIMDSDSVLKLIDVVKKDHKNLVDKLVPELLTEFELRKIFVNLIREKVSIKDIVFVFERLCDYARYSKEPDELSEKLRIDMARQICLSNVNEDKVLYAVKLSDKLDNLLSLNSGCTAFGDVFTISAKQMENIVNNTAITLMKIHQNIGQQPIVLCSPQIRLSLYRLLVQYIPTIVVMSDAELITDIKVEEVDIIRTRNRLRSATS